MSNAGNHIQVYEVKQIYPADIGTADQAVLTGLAVTRLCSQTMPRSARHVATVEWAWSPSSERMDRYFISMCTHHRHWVLWLQPYDDNWGKWAFAHAQVATIRRGLDEPSAARYLLKGYWTNAKVDGLDRFHYITNHGVLDCEVLSQLASKVWLEAQR